MIQREASKILINSILAWLPNFMELDNPIIAGGFIRAFYAGENPKDMDLYFHTKEAADKTTKILQKYGWIIIAETDKAITFKKDDKIVQVINYITGQPEEIIKVFDFTVCMACVVLSSDGKNISGTEYYHNDFFEHLAGRVLNYQGSPMPLSSLKRVIKYIKRGYHICDEHLISIANDIAKTINFNDIESIQKHIDGLDPFEERRIRIID